MVLSVFFVLKRQVRGQPAQNCTRDWKALSPSATPEAGMDRRGDRERSDVATEEHSGPAALE
jgi:hypothetical protein